MYVACVPNRGSPPAYLLREEVLSDGQGLTMLRSVPHGPCRGGAT